jgi:hypothetical protein
MVPQHSRQVDGSRATLPRAQPARVAIPRSTRPATHGLDFDRRMRRISLSNDEALLVWLTLGLKFLLLLGGLIAFLWLDTGATGPLRVWNRWDTGHYTDLVVYGYRAQDVDALIGPHGYRVPRPGEMPLKIVFFPLFPWLATAVYAVIGNPLLSVFAVSAVSSLFVAPLMYRLVRADEARSVALKSAWLLLIFPTAYFLHIGYTESLFLALTLGSMLAARRSHWWIAGMLGGLAALTRVNGLVLLLALSVEAATQWMSQPRGQRQLRAEWAAIGLVAVGFGGYLALNQAVFGDPFKFVEIQRIHWFKELAPPWEGISAAFSYLPYPHLVEAQIFYSASELAFVALGLAATVFAAFRLRPSWFAWAAGNWLLFTSTSFLLSVPRYTLTLFPLMVAMALLARGRAAFIAISAISLAGFVYFAARFASGMWAF